MQLLFSEAGRQKLDHIVQPNMLCAFDFDGTLTPIVTDPKAARLSPDIRQRLLALANYVPVAIITGRSLNDIRHRLGYEPDFVIGNHGIEGMPGWEFQAQMYETLCNRWTQQLTQAWQSRDPCFEGLRIEHKQYSLSIHYRQARQPDVTAHRLEHLFKLLTPAPRIISGKCVFNLVPQDAVHKGQALEQLMKITRASSALYAGDDVTDEDVFRLQRPDVLSVRVEPAADSAADFFLPHYLEMAQLLDDLVDRLQQACTTGSGRSMGSVKAKSRRLNQAATSVK